MVGEEDDQTRYHKYDGSKSNINKNKDDIICIEKKKKNYDHIMKNNNTPHIF